MNYEQFAQSLASAEATDVAATMPMWSTEKEREAHAAQAAAVAEREAQLAAYDPHDDPENPFRHLLPAPGTAPAPAPIPHTEDEDVPDKSTADQLRRIADELRRQARDLEETAARIESEN